MKKIVFVILTLLLFTASVCASNNKIQISDIGGSNPKFGLNKDGVSVSKIVSKTSKENYFDITLDVKTSVNIKDVINNSNISVVIVMDVSNTMVTTNIDGTSIKNKKMDTRYDAAIKAGEDFINTFYKYSENSSGIREIGYVAFNSDAKKIFDLENCKTKSASIKLINNMKNSTNKIVTEKDYNNSKKRFTNIEAGLKMAYDMLKTSKSDNKYIIILSDGFPTTYIKSGYIGYDTYTSNATSQSEGNFYNSNKKLPCSYGTSYSDMAALRALKIAKKIKQNNITIFSIGTLNGQKSVDELTSADGNNFSVVDSFLKSENNKNYNKDYVIGNTLEDYKNWLKNEIASGYYFEATATEELKAKYKSIFTEIKAKSLTKVIPSWVVNDKINDSKDNYIEFLGFYNDNKLSSSLSGTLGENNSDTCSVVDDTILWDLKNSGYTIDKTSGKTIYHYSIKYKIRLKNEFKKFINNYIYNTNGITKLDYKILEDNVLSDLKSIDFKIPKVMGYLTTLKFRKVSSNELKGLANVKFKLIHSDQCKKEDNIEIADFISSSDEDGMVIFNIPSGHKYILKEISTLDDYVLDNTEYEVNASYGEIYINPNLKIDKENILYLENEKVQKEIYITVNKVWKSQSEIPKKIEIQLYKNGKPYGDIIELNDSNNWLYTWQVLDSDDEWSVDEVTKLNNYKKSIEQDGNTFTITNVEIIDNPKTFDNIKLIATCFIISIIGISLILMYKKENR